MDEMTRQYYLGRIDAKKECLDELLRWHPDLEGTLAAVKAHALANYNSGWDVVVECYEDYEIALRIVGARTAEEAIDTFKIVAEIHLDRIAGGRNSAF